MAQYKESSINKYADSILNKINNCIKDAMRHTPVYSGAIVNYINTDGTVDVYIPPNANKIFTRISNQTPFELKIGDSVELLLKDGTYNNCWIIAKHQSNFIKDQEWKNDISKINENIQGINKNIDTIKMDQIPKCPSNNDGTFILKATVTAGEVTYNWVSES